MREFLSLHNPSTLVAYLDGGTGSMMLQAAIAGLLSAAFVAKSKWAQLRAVLSRVRKSDNAGQ